MLDSDRDRLAGSLFHILKGASKRSPYADEAEVIFQAMVRRASAIQEEQRLDEQASQWLYDNQWG